MEKNESSKNLKELLVWLETNRPDLVKKAKDIQAGAIPQSGSINVKGKRFKKIFVKFILFFKELLFVSPMSLHGNAYVSNRLKQRAKTTAYVMTASNQIDAVSNIPTIFYAFKGLGVWGASFSAVILALLILKITNDLSSGVAQTQTHNFYCKEHKFNLKELSWLLAAFIPLVLINLCQSIATGVSVEAFNNQTQLSLIHASKLVDEKMKQIKSEGNKDEAECKNGKSMQLKLDHVSPEWNNIEVRLYGEFKDKDKKWNEVPYERLPICRRVDRKHKELQKLEKQRSNDGSDLFFLKNRWNSTYTTNFDEKQEISSGPQLIGTAFTNIFNKLQSSKFTELGLTLYLLSFSLLTSSASCWMAIAFAFTEEAQESNNENNRKKINQWFSDMRRELDEVDEEDNEGDN